MSLLDLKLTPQRPYGGTGILKQFYNGILPDEVFKQACRSYALQVYNGLLQSSGGAKIVIDKSPRYYYALEFIDSLFPHARRIGLIRNPLSIIASYKKVYERGGEPFDLAADLWDPRFNIKIADITVGLFRYLNYFKADNPYAHRLYYESLVTAPRDEMMKLCRFLGIAYEEGLERYGNYMDTAKAGLYFSMGVGDPYVNGHKEAHQDSVDSWRETLSKGEIEGYCRVIGAQVFHDLGYSEQLQEAERLTGVQFELEPNRELMNLRTRQLEEATGCKWADSYGLCSDAPSGLPSDSAEAGLGQGIDPHVLQLQITLRSLEMRLEKSYASQAQLRSQLDNMKAKINRVKSMIPFGNRLSHWATHYLIGGKK